jgi:hypothetical protein
MARRIKYLVLALASGWASMACSAVAVADRSLLWNDHIIPYRICEVVDGSNADPADWIYSGCDHGGLPLQPPEAAKVRQAVADWNALFSAELRFQEAETLSRSDRGVLFARSRDPAICSTNRVGRPRQAKRTRVRIGTNCNGFAALSTPVHTITHEMMHVAGFYHEQQRPDRDTFLKTRWRPSLVRLFLDGAGGRPWAKGSRTYRPMQVLGDYDFRSIMHYHVLGSKMARLTGKGMERLEAQGMSLADPGKRDELSPEDIAGMKQLYAGQAAAQGLTESR